MLQITYDVSQIPREALPDLRAQLLNLLKAFAPGPKPIRTQLCVCLAILAIQMLEWKDVLPMVVSTLGSDAASHACMLEFLRVLPEEVTEGRKITLTVCGPKSTSLWTSTSTLRLRDYTRVKV
jgi:transportin-3